MTDVLGPASDHSVTVRPARTISRGGANTWFIDCTGPEADDGTLHTADFYNDLLAQLRTLISNSGIDANNADDMVWRAVQSVGIRYGVDTGSADNLAATFSPPVSSLYPGLALFVKVFADNTGATDIEVEDFPAKAIVRGAATALSAGDLKANMIAFLVYDGTSFQLVAGLQQAAAIDGATAPFFPEVLTNNGVMGVSAGTASVIVDPAHTFQHRGFKKFSTDEFLLAARTLVTTANKTYHLRWDAPGTGAATPSSSYPSGRFTLNDLANGTYNPLARVEADPAFDTTYDSMLVARVVTNGSNVATITPLLNRAALNSSVSRTTTASSSSSSIIDNYTLNWSRQPVISLAGWNENVTVSNTDGEETLITPFGRTRYGFSVGSYTFSVENATYFAPLYDLNMRA